MQTVNFTWPLGFQSDALHSGVKKNQQLDLTWVISKNKFAAAGVYTKNQFQAAPVQIMKQLINHTHQLKGIVINSGNANSFTGKHGLTNVKKMQHDAAKKLNCKPELIGIASTGLIGKQLPMNKILTGIQKLGLKNSLLAPEAIITTDSTKKKVSVTFKINQKSITMSGFSKGSGMIHPNMGTTLGFITTDANVDPNFLQMTLSELIETSYNQITVDGCMSTNDMVLALANGASQNKIINQNHPEKQIFIAAFKFVLQFLAKEVAKDGEGSNKLIEATVNNAKNQTEANQISKAIVGSNLIKAMINGGDPNWGRIIQSIGQTKSALAADKLSIQIQNILVLRNGMPLSIDPPSLMKRLNQAEIKIEVDLGVGNATGIAWGCDLTYQYVEINAAYEEA